MKEISCSITFAAWPHQELRRKRGHEGTRRGVNIIRSSIFFKGNAGGIWNLNQAIGMRNGLLLLSSRLGMHYESGTTGAKSIKAVNRMLVLDEVNVCF